MYAYRDDVSLEITINSVQCHIYRIRQRLRYDKEPINYIESVRSIGYRLNELIAAKEKEHAKIMRHKQSLYQDWKDGLITHNDYRHMSEDYERQNEAISEVISSLKKERDELENGIDINPFLATFRKKDRTEPLLGAAR